MSEPRRGGSATDVPVRALAIVHVVVPLPPPSSGDAVVVTAAVSSAGKLRLALWHVALDGSKVTRRASNVDRAIREVALATEQVRAVTAVIDGDGRLRVSSTTRKA